MTILVKEFIQANYTPYYGDDSFLEPPTERTIKLWAEITALLKEEQKVGVLDVSSDVASSILAHSPGFLNNEIIVGLQTNAPLKRAVFPKGGKKMAANGLKAYGFSTEELPDVGKDHNEAVFDMYTPEILACRKSGVITGLPDSYSRGRLVGDYRRVPLYGIDYLIEQKIEEKVELNDCEFSDDVLRLRLELSDQIRALKDLKKLAENYGVDISNPAKTAKDAIQWLYFAFLAATKDQNGAATSLGRVSTFLDIYIERDISLGILNESTAQELVDDFIIKLRLIRFLRTPEYNALFTGDPVWLTESIGGVGIDGRPLVTKTSYRFLNTLFNLDSAPEPNLTVLWSNSLPENFKRFCAEVSIETSSIQYENDDILRKEYGDDFCIACCVSPMIIGKMSQYFGARGNLAKLLLYSINGGVDEISGVKVAKGLIPITSEYLEYEEVLEKFDKAMDWLAKVYMQALCAIHYSADRYAYEALQYSLHDRDIIRMMATGIAGLSIVANSLSAIKYAKVKAIRNENGIVVDYETIGDFPMYGNNDDRVDDIAVSVVKTFMDKLRKQHTYRNAIPSMSILTITSNIVYGKLTGSTPDGRKKGEAFAPGANPTSNTDTNGFLASSLSVSKLPFSHASDGISFTSSFNPSSLGKTTEDRISNLSRYLDGYFLSDGYHINVNVLRKADLIDAMNNPDKWGTLTVRVSGYAVRFNSLTQEQKLDVINRTFF